MNIDQVAKQKARQAFTVPDKSGDYAPERITFGAVEGPNTREDSFQAVTALLEDVGADGANTAPSGMVAELWLSQVPTGPVPAYAFTDANYFFAGQVLCPANISTSLSGVVTSYGAATWAVAGWPLAQIRIKSGGVGGSVTVSATAL